MPKKPHHADHDALPSREDILAFIAREKKDARERGHNGPLKIGKREIAREFGVRGGQKIALKQLLRDMQDDGALEKRGKRLHKAGELPPVLLCDITGRDSDGELVAAPAEWEAEDGSPAPRIILVSRKARRGEPAPGVGDRALVRVEKEGTHHTKPQYTGRIIKLLNKARPRTLGIYRRLPSGIGRIEPVDKKRIGQDLDVIADSSIEVADGDLVSVDILKTGRYGLPRAKIKERLGKIGSEKSIAHIAVLTHGIPNVFSEKALTEAESAEPATMKGREDWRELPLLTIDPADAKDHDDAVHAVPDEDPANRGGFVLTVAIADVAAYVTPGSALDREALDRGNSVYFPGQVVPMLPERISNDLCSLRPLEDRPSMAVRMVIDANGRKIGHSFHRVMMRSAAKLAYQQAQAAIDGQPDETSAPLLEPVLKPLWAAYEVLKKARDARHPLDLDLPERRLVLDAEGKVDRVIVPPRLDAHRLIEEFMILANVAAAETLEAHSQRLIYRAHDEPSVEKLNGLGEFLASIGIKLAKGQVLKPEQFNGILARVKGGEYENAVNEVVLRTQAQAEYVADNYGHFGLNLRRYAHFTSPIRRYADLIVHRALIKALGLGKDGLPDSTVPELPEIAARISAAERRAMAAERETTDRLIANHLSEQIGATFQGRISGVTRSGLFVKLAETGADGFVPISTLGYERYHYDEASHALIASRSGETFRIGDTVDVKLVEALPMAGALRFEVLSEGRKAGRIGLKTGRGNKPPFRGGKGKAKAGQRRPGRKSR
ncbi:MAG: ribonuclease R [Beijerinckiaceae bacterium]